MKQAGNKLNYLIGGHVKQLRKKSKLTQSNLGDQLGVTFQQIQKIEKGVNRVFAHQLVHLCKENQWDINEFMALESSIEAHNS
jgi:transcriptional regulator with XRE-family HTH domain|tara:strand:+ start:926 stop:1174 length:249 start_codon:yes stop_codon:yes gene_type:complete